MGLLKGEVSGEMLVPRLHTPSFSEKDGKYRSKSKQRVFLLKNRGASDYYL